MNIIAISELFKRIFSYFFYQRWRNTTGFSHGELSTIHEIFEFKIFNWDYFIKKQFQRALFYAKIDLLKNFIDKGFFHENLLFRNWYLGHSTSQFTI